MNLPIAGPSKLELDQRIPTEVLDNLSSESRTCIERLLAYEAPSLPE
jgi:hypothetical protein